MYRIKVNYQSEEILATENHEFFCRDLTKAYPTDVDFEWMPVEKLLSKKIAIGVKFSGKYKNPVFIANNHLEMIEKMQEWFMLGYFLNNGWLSKNEDDKIYFLISDKNNYKYFIISTISIILDLEREGGSDIYIGESKRYYNILQQLGKYSCNKKIPNWMHDSSSENLESFIIGCKTSDNYLTKGFGKNKHHVFVTNSFHLAYGFQRLYLKIGRILKIKQKKDRYELKEYSDKLYYDYSFMDFVSHIAWFGIKSIKVENVRDMKVYQLNTTDSCTMNNIHIRD